MKKDRGFTLIEMMIVVAVLALLAAIAIPNFTGYLMKSRRSDGITALLALQHAQEKFRANCASYAAALLDTNNDTTNDSSCVPGTSTYQLEFDTSSIEGWYSLSVSGATAIAYTATATAVAGGKQASDTKCKTLILTVSATNPNGLRESKDSADNASTGCW